MLLSGLSVLYATHMLLALLNVSIVAYVLALSMQSAVVSSRCLFVCSVFVEMVWLLIPTAIVAVMMVRVIAIQVAEEELARCLPWCS